MGKEDNISVDYPRLKDHPDETPYPFQNQLFWNHPLHICVSKTNPWPRTILKTTFAWLISFFLLEMLFL